MIGLLGPNRNTLRSTFSYCIFVISRLPSTCASGMAGRPYLCEFGATLQGSWMFMPTECNHPGFATHVGLVGNPEMRAHLHQKLIPPPRSLLCCCRLPALHLMQSARNGRFRLFGWFFGTVKQIGISNRHCSV